MAERQGKPFELTASLEDYLEAIKEVIDNSDEDHAHSVAIAKRLKVAKPSVTYALGILRERGYINYNVNYPVTLTPLGEQEAARVIRRHRELKAFLKEVLCLEDEQSETTACRIEHVIDDHLLARLTCLNQVFRSAEAEGMKAALFRAYAATDAAAAQMPCGEGVNEATVSE